MKSGFLSRIKGSIVRPKAAPRRIKAGLLKGLWMDLDFSSQMQVYLGLSERELDPWFRRFTADITAAIDIGANIGIYTLFFLAKTPASQVLSFEPSADAREKLRFNLQLNGFLDDARLVISDKFVGSEESADSCSLDSLAGRIAPPCLIKIDVDGPELTILEGAKALLGRPEMRLIVETHSQDLEDACLKLLKQFEYDAHVVPNAWWRKVIPEQRPIPHNRWLVASRRPF